MFHKDFSNPLVRPHLQFYPEEPSDAISEVWHAEKWHEFPSIYLMPMYIDLVTNHHFYVNEIAQLKNRQFVLPLKWKKFEGYIVADAHLVIEPEVNDFLVCLH